MKPPGVFSTRGDADFKCCKAAARSGRRRGRSFSLGVFAVNRRTRRHRERTGYYEKLARIPKTQYPRPWLEGDQAETSETEELDSMVSGIPTGMCVTWLGTSSGVPTLQRNVSSICVRWPNNAYLFDAGEGTQVQMLKTDIFPAYIRRIFVTHLHGDHCFGLSGMLNLISKLRLYNLKEEMLNIYGPPGIVKLLQMSLPYWYEKFIMPITITEFCWDEEDAQEATDVTAEGKVFVARMPPTSALSTAPRNTTETVRTSKGTRTKLSEGIKRGYEWEIHCEDGITVTAAQLQHRVPCWGYVVKEPDSIPDNWEYEHFQSRNKAEGAPVAKIGRKVVILGDTCNSDALVQAAKNADMVSHEATFARGMEKKAMIAQHSTAFMAGRFARKIEAEKLVLTHFSPRYQRLEGSENCENIMGSLVDEAKEGFCSENVEAAHDFFTYDVPLKTQGQRNEANEGHELPKEAQHEVIEGD